MRSVVGSRFARSLTAAALGGALAIGGATAAPIIGTGHAQAAPAAPASFARPAIVILGYGLTDSGGMRDVLMQRVITGLAVAQFFPSSPIIVTGGNPHNGKTEASQMAGMLMLFGFPRNRIIIEDKANSTVQNAQFSVPLAKKAGTTGIILVTSSSHQPRADGNFRDAGGNVIATVSFPDRTFNGVNPLADAIQAVRDVLSPFGIG